MITLTDKAASEILRIKAADTAIQEAATLRIQVIGGGCSGLSYKLTWTDTPDEGDMVALMNGVSIVVDKKSLLFLNGMELDFSDGLNGTGFTFNNPNAKRTCGCGTSFSV